MTIGQRIAQFRKAKGLSQEDLAERVGVSRQAVSKWELDQALPDAEKIIALAAALGVSTDQILLDPPAGSGSAPDGAAGCASDQQYHYEGGGTVPPTSAPSQPTNATWNGLPASVGRFIQRHGYKAGYLLIVYGVAALIFGLVMVFVIHTFFSTVESEFSQPDFGFLGIENEMQIQFPDGLTPAEEDAIRRELERQIGGGW